MFQAVFLGGKFYEKENSIEEINEIIGFEEDKKAVQTEIIARLSIIDFLLERAYVNKYITEKELHDYSKRLEEIIKMIKGWMKSSE